MTARRGRNEGSIYRRVSDGRWVGAVHIGYRNGRRVRRTVYGRTRREVNGKVQHLMAEADRGSLSELSKLDLEAYSVQWLASIKSSVRPRTFESYSDTMRVHVIPNLGHVRITAVTPAQVQQLLDEKLQAGLSPRSVELIHAIVRLALARAQKWGLVARNVATLVSPPRVPKTEPRILTADEARLLLRYLDGDRLQTLYLIALALGLRQGEALALQWHDVDLNDLTVAIRHTLQWDEQRPVLREPKTRESRRTLLMPPLVAGSLREHRVRQNRERLLAGMKWRDSGHVFTTRHGGPLRSRATTQRLQRKLAEAGLPRVTFHSLRHACASYLIGDGVSPRVVQELLGHSQISTTLGIYSHVLQEMRVEVADRMEELLSRPAS